MNKGFHKKYNLNTDCNKSRRKLLMFLVSYLIVSPCFAACHELMLRCLISKSNTGHCICSQIGTKSTEHNLRLGDFYPRENFPKYFCPLILIKTVLKGKRPMSKSHMKEKTNGRNNLRKTYVGKTPMRKNLVDKCLLGKSSLDKNLVSKSPISKSSGDKHRKNVQWTNVKGTNFQGTKIKGTNIHGINLHGTDFQGTQCLGQNSTGQKSSGQKSSGQKSRGQKSSGQKFSG